jgi:predicted nucleotidyltransferase
MTRAEFFARIAPHRAELEAAGVSRIGVFGSVARDEAKSDSDVDILVEFHNVPDLWAFAGLKRRLEEIVGAKVDLCTPRSLKPRVRERVLRDARYAA